MTTTTATQIPTTQRIQIAYNLIATNPGDMVTLEALRPLLGYITREDADAALLELEDAGIISLIPECIVAHLTQDEQDAAIKIGPSEYHLIAIR